MNGTLTTIPQIQVVFETGDEHILLFADIADEDASPGDVSDIDLARLVGDRLGRPINLESMRMKVSRPDTGHILIGPIGEYGGNQYRNVRSDDEVHEVMDWVDSGIENGSHFPGMSYEDGMRAMFDWLTLSEAESPTE